MPELFFLFLAFAAGGLATLLFGPKKPAFREQIPGLELPKAKPPKKVRKQIEDLQENYEVSLENIAKDNVAEAKENSTSAKEALNVYRKARGGK